MAAAVTDPVEKLIESCLQEALRGLQSNLAVGVWGLKNGWLSGDDSTLIQDCLSVLKAHLAESGESEDDETILRIGLTVPGFHRGTIPPLAVLHPNRGGFAVKRQREAAGQIGQLRAALEIGRMLVPDLPPSTELALGELLDRTTFSTEPKRWRIQAIRELSAEALKRLSDRAASLAQNPFATLRDIGNQMLEEISVASGKAGG